ncbi:MAG: alpha/beta hydrolase family protein, partial [Marinilabiliaceae bacterium]
ISNVNTKTLAKLNLGHADERWITTTDGKRMLTWVVCPPDFDPSQKYPALLYCQGGPQSTISQFWSRRWNFALMAANDYVVVAPCRRGMPGFGIEWNEQISKDYGGQNMKDYLVAIDTLAAEPFVDEGRLGCVGASYGGFSVYWLAGHHEKRFKTFIAHCGIFNLEQLYSTTEELFFVNWDLGGPYWDERNAVAQASFAQSPHRFVGKWDTPILVIHGEKDFRIPYTQGMGAFDAARMKGIEAEFLFFPEECHWVQKPQNSILWHREFYRWLDRWLK